MAKFYYGGQAVMEGVMMRGRKSVAVAVRRADGAIYLHEEPLNATLYQNKLLQLPFLRGILLLWDTLGLGTRMMMLSASIAVDTSHVDAPVESASSAEEHEIAETRDGEQLPKIGGASFVLALLIPLLFAIAVFFVVPLLITSLLHNQIGAGWLSLVVEGGIRLALLLGYLYLIGRMADIQRVFGYHGAEHKAINALEQGDPLDVPHVRRASRVHTRCGTGFLLLVMVVSIVVFAFIGTPSLLSKIVLRIILIPVVASIAYELMRLGAANYRIRIVRWLLAPGLALQGLTTREPDDSMIECAIASLKSVLSHDEAQEPAPELADVSSATVE